MPIPMKSVSTDDLPGKFEVSYPGLDASVRVTAFGVERFTLGMQRSGMAFDLSLGRNALTMWRDVIDAALAFEFPLPMPPEAYADNDSGSGD